MLRGPIPSHDTLLPQPESPHPFLLLWQVSRKPLFPGKNHVDQLNLISSIVGTPTPEELDIVTNEQALKFMKSMPFKPRCAKTSSQRAVEGRGVVL